MRFSGDGHRMMAELFSPCIRGEAAAPELRNRQHRRIVKSARRDFHAVSVKETRQVRAVGTRDIAAPGGRKGEYGRRALWRTMRVEG